MRTKALSQVRREFRRQARRKRHSLGRVFWQQSPQLNADLYVDSSLRDDAGEGFHHDFPSPWHAALWLNYYQAHHASEIARQIDAEVRQSVESGARQLDLPPYLHYLYRGQRAEYSAVTSTLSRAKSVGDAVAQTRRVLFRRCITEAYCRSIGVRPPSGQIEAMARHYGAPSHLIDMTVDPWVAVYFACLNNDGEGLVHTFRAADLRLRGQLRLYVPPTFAIRPYRQRGVFVKTENDAIPRAFYVARFPADRRYVNDFHRYVDREIYAAEPWFQNLRVMVDQLASEWPTQPSRHELMAASMTIMSEIGLPRSLEDPAKRREVNHSCVLMFEELTYWLVIYPTAVKGFAEVWDLEAAEALVRDNPQTAGLWASRLESQGQLATRLGRVSAGRGLRERAKFIREMMPGV